MNFYPGYHSTLQNGHHTICMVCPECGKAVEVEVDYDITYKIKSELDIIILRPFVPSIACYECGAVMNISDHRLNNAINDARKAGFHVNIFTASNMNFIGEQIHSFSDKKNLNTVDYYTNAEENPIIVIDASGIGLDAFETVTNNLKKSRAHLNIEIHSCSSSRFLFCNRDDRRSFSSVKEAHHHYDTVINELVAYLNAFVIEYCKIYKEPVRK